VAQTYLSHSMLCGFSCELCTHVCARDYFRRQLHLHVFGYHLRVVNGVTVISQMLGVLIVVTLQGGRVLCWYCWLGRVGVCGWQKNDSGSVFSSFCKKITVFGSVSVLHN